MKGLGFVCELEVNYEIQYTALYSRSLRTCIILYVAKLTNLEKNHVEELKHTKLDIDRYFICLLYTSDAADE